MKKLLVLLALVGASACNDINVNKNPYEPSQTYPPSNQNNPNYYKDTIEYRVNGTAQFATIRFSNSLDGTSQVISSLPFSIRAETNASSVFVSLDVVASAPTIAFLSAQIFVNGVLFREASVTTSTPTLSISGTFRH